MNTYLKVPALFMFSDFDTSADSQLDKDPNCFSFSFISFTTCLQIPESIVPDSDIKTNTKNISKGWYKIRKKINQHKMFFFLLLKQCKIGYRN